MEPGSAAGEGGSLARVAIKLGGDEKIPPGK